MSLVVRLMRVLGVAFALASVAPAVALAADPIASTSDAIATGPSTATVDGNIEPGGLPTSYQVKYGLASSSWCTSWGTAGSPASSTTARTLAFADTASHNVAISLSGLTPATSYCVDLVATNSAGPSDGGQVAFTAGIPVASTTDGLATGASTATIDGSVNPSGQATTYKVEYDLANSAWCTSGETSGSPASSTAAQALGFLDSTWHAVSISLSGLTPGASYCVDLVATNSAGPSDGGQVSLAPGIAGAYTADAIATGAGTATVDGSIDPLAQSTTYTIEYDLASSTWCASGEMSGSPASSTTPQTLGFTDNTWHDVSVSLSGLTAGASYCTDLIASNSSGTADGGQVSFAADVPSASTGAALATGASTATVTGSVNPSGRTTTYKVEYSFASSTWCASDESSGSPANSTSPQTLGFTDSASHTVSISLSGLTAGASYCVDLVATNAAGTSDGGQIPLGPGLPSAQTIDALAAGAATATVDGSVDPLAQVTNYTVEYDLASSTWCTSGGSSGSPANATAPQTLGFTDGASHSVSISLSGLTAGASYCVDLVATNSSGASDGGQIALIAGVPSASTADATATGATTATVDGSVDPSGQTTTYQVKYDLAASTWCASGEASGSPASATAPQTLGFTDSASHAVSISLSGLTAGASYCVDLVATNPAGTSDGGQISLVGGIPSASTVDAAATGATTATVDGSVNPLAQSTTYTVEYDLASSTWCFSGGSSGSPANSTTMQTLGFTDAAAHSVAVSLSGLMPATSYCVDLVATNPSGTGDGGQISLTTGGGPTPPALATGAATGVSAVGATISGTVNPNGLATSYQFQYGTTASYGSSTTSASAGSGSSPATESASIAGLTANTTYHYRLVATSAAGTSRSPDQTFTTAPVPVLQVAPGVITGSARSVSAAGATVSGIVNPSGLATTFQFQYGTTASYGSSTTSASAGSGAIQTPETVTITGLTANTTYHYRLVATSTAGTTDGLDQTFTTAAVAPTSPSQPAPPTAPVSSTSPTTPTIPPRTPTVPTTPTAPVASAAPTLPAAPTMSGVRLTVPTLKLQLSEPATVIVAIAASGKSHACVNTANSSRCARSAAATSFTLHGVAGANRFKLRVPSLAPGRYGAAVVARGTGGRQSLPVTFTFTVSKPKKK